MSNSSLTFCRGVLLGGLIGDCYGYIYEDKRTVTVDIPSLEIQNTIQGKNIQKLCYTDDTQMGLGILRSARSQGGFNAEHLAKEFATNYFNDGAHRYYGGTVTSLFRSMRDAHFKNPFVYAANLFNGSGSYGNGGAMRASPAALYALKLSDLDFDTFIINVTKLTHTNPLAICGALLQAFAVRQLYSFNCNSKEIDPIQFIDDLLKRLKATKCPPVNFKEPTWAFALSEYELKLGRVKHFLTQSIDPSVAEIVELLGNDLNAINSVPTAIYVFLRSLKSISNIKFDSIPLRTLILTISLGGDTDSIGTMACSLAGGYVGLPLGDYKNIPQSIINRCEQWDVIEEYAQWLSQRIDSEEMRNN